MLLNRTVSVVVILASIAGLMVTVGHYMPLPEEIVRGEHYPAPGKEWFVEQLALYKENAALGALHVIPAMIFMLLVPLQLSGYVRSRLPAFHRWSGRVLLPMIVLFSISSVVLAVVMPFGNWVELLGAVVIGGACLVFMVRGVICARQGQYGAHRVWMSYMLAMAFAPVTMRVFYVAGIELGGLDPRAIFGFCMFVGMAMNLLLVRWWLGRGKSSASIKVATQQL